MQRLYGCCKLHRRKKNISNDQLRHKNALFFPLAIFGLRSWAQFYNMPPQNEKKLYLLSAFVISHIWQESVDLAASALALSGFSNKKKGFDAKIMCAELYCGCTTKTYRNISHEVPIVTRRNNDKMKTMRYILMMQLKERRKEKK